MVLQSMLSSLEFQPCSVSCFFDQLVMLAPKGNIWCLLDVFGSLGTQEEKGGGPRLRLGWALLLAPGPAFQEMDPLTQCWLFSPWPLLGLFLFGASKTFPTNLNLNPLRSNHFSPPSLVPSSLIFFCFTGILSQDKLISYISR